MNKDRRASHDTFLPTLLRHFVVFFFPKKSLVIAARTPVDYLDHLNPLQSRVLLHLSTCGRDTIARHRWRNACYNVIERLHSNRICMVAAALARKCIQIIVLAFYAMVIVTGLNLWLIKTNLCRRTPWIGRTAVHLSGIWFHHEKRAS